MKLVIWYASPPRVTSLFSVTGGQRHARRSYGRGTPTPGEAFSQHHWEASQRARPVVMSMT
jgi:hypothetical protein